MLSNVSSTFRLPSPVSVFGTWKAARGFSAFMRLSKLSTSISRNFRSRPAAAAPRLAGQVGEHAHHERQLDFFSAPYSSTSYSICTRGARLRAMNF
jgi:hypothetical protein